MVKATHPIFKNKKKWPETPVYNPLEEKRRGTSWRRSRSIRRREQASGCDSTLTICLYMASAVLDNLLLQDQCGSLYFRTKERSNETIANWEVRNPKCSSSWKAAPITKDSWNPGDCLLAPIVVACQQWNTTSLFLREKGIMLLNTSKMNFIQRRMFPARTELLPLRNTIQSFCNKLFSFGWIRCYTRSSFLRIRWSWGRLRGVLGVPSIWLIEEGGEPIHARTGAQ